MEPTRKSTIDPEQRLLIENAQERIKQKKRLFRHFIFFLAGSVLFIVLNVVLEYGIDFRPFNTYWFVWAILIWLFILLVHVFNVFVTNRLLSKKWEEEQMEYLVAKQRERIEKLQQKVDKQHPLPQEDYRDNGKKPMDPNKPINS